MSTAMLSTTLPAEALVDSSLTEGVSEDLGEIVDVPFSAPEEIVEPEPLTTTVDVPSLLDAPVFEEPVVPGSVGLPAGEVTAPASGVVDLGSLPIALDVAGATLPAETDVTVATVDPALAAISDVRSAVRVDFAAQGVPVDPVGPVQLTVDVSDVAMPESAGLRDRLQLEVWFGCQVVTDEVQCLDGTEVPDTRYDPLTGLVGGPLDIADLRSQVQARRAEVSLTPLPAVGERLPARPDLVLEELPTAPDALADEAQTESTRTAPVVPPTCDGDGTAGRRVEVLHLTTGDGDPTDVARILEAVRGADAAVVTTAAEQGGERAVRFVHGADCLPTITTVTAASTPSFPELVDAVALAGHDRDDRVYLVFSDSFEACGAAQLFADDRRVAENANNGGAARYAAIGAACWEAETAVHELGHLLGGVQPSAPNASPGFHCTDAVDALCESDASGSHTELVCEDDGTLRLDCNGDDWFNAAPVEGAYLAGHWNVANSGFLVGAEELPSSGEAGDGTADTFDMVVVASDSDGPNGNFSASKLSTLATYQVGLFSGAAELGYEIPVPPAAAGPAPSVNFSYSSASIDGMNSATNNQSGPIGLGWSMATASVTRHLKSCGGSHPGDRCSLGLEYSISLNGRASKLVQVSGNSFRLQDDPAWRVTRKGGASNGDHGGIWWEVTDTSGTVHVLGRSAAAAATVPVYTNTSSCSHSKKMCDHVYEWFLESTTDTNGNAVVYEYVEDVNWYNTTREYVNYDYTRDVRLREVRYTTNTAGTATANARVLFNWEMRCGDASTTFGHCTFPSAFTDTPTDLRCANVIASCNDRSPTYWSMHRLSSVQTQVLRAAQSAPYDGRWNTVATHDLAQSAPRPPSLATGEKSEPKTLLYRVHRREGGAYETYGFSELGHGTHDGSSGVGTSNLDVHGGKVFSSFGPGEYVRWEDVYLGDGSGRATTLVVRFSANSDDHNLEVRLGGRTGTRIATITNGGGTNGWRTREFNVTLPSRSGAFIDQVYLVGTGANSMDVSWIRFAPADGKFNSIPSLAPVDFYGGDWRFLDNRVNSGNGLSPMRMARVGTMTNALGGQVRFTYAHPAATDRTARCTTEPSKWSGLDWSNVHMHCYPQWVALSSTDQGYVNFWKWVVTKQEVFDTFSGNSTQTTTYAYTSPAFAKSVAPGVTGATWNVFRGHAVVRAYDAVGSTETRFFQGMHGDDKSGSNTGTKSVSVTRSTGATLTDYRWLSGRPHETRRLNSSGSTQSRTFLDYSSAQTAGSGTHAARRVNQTRQYDFNYVGTDTVTQTNWAYDSYNNMTVLIERGNNATSADDRNTRWYYTYNTSKWIVDKPKMEVTKAGATDAGTQLRKQTFMYDNSTTYGATPSRGNLTRRCDYASATGPCLDTDFVLDGRGRATKVINPDEQASTTTFDATHGWVTKGVNPLGHATSTAYDGYGRIASITNEAGKRTDMAYDEFGRLVKAWQPSDRGTSIPTVEFQYAASQRPARIRQLSKQDDATRLDNYSYYDGFGREIQSQRDHQVSGQRIVTSTQHNNIGSVRFVSDPFQIAGDAGANTSATLSNGFFATDWAQVHRTYNVYDTNHRVSRTDKVRPGGSVEHRTSHTYSGWATTTTEPSGDKTIRTTDAFGNLVKVQEYNGTSIAATTTYGYNRAGDLTTIDAPGSGAIAMTYDLMGRRTRMVDPDIGTWEYRYDGAGDLLAQRDGRGQWIYYERDDIGRTKHERAGSLSGEILASYTYDSVRKGEPASEVAYTQWGEVRTDYLLYDIDGYLRRSELTIPGPAGGTYRREWTYNAAGQVETQRMPGGPAGTLGDTITTTYDRRTGQLLSSSSTAQGQLVADTDYDHRGSITQQTFGPSGGVATNRVNYAAATGRVTEIKASSPTKGVLLHLLYDKYDADGQLRRVVDHTNGGQRLCLNYDGLDRLTRAYTGSNDCTSVDTTRGAAEFDITYSYDSTGRINKVAQAYPAAPTRTYGYGSKPHAVTSVTGGDSYAYDAGGNMTVRDVDDVRQTLEYDAHRRLRTVRDDQGSVTEFLYDASGNRVAKWDGDTYTAYVGDDYEVSTGANRVDVPGFETADAWTTEAYAEFPATSHWRHTAGTAGPHSGAHGRSIANHAYAYVASEPVPVQASTSYDLTGWVKGEIGTGSRGSWLIRAHMFGADGASLGYVDTASSGGSWVSGSWVNVGRSFTTKPGTTSVEVRLFSYQTSGWVLFDDLELVKTGSTTNLLSDPGVEDASAWRTWVSSAAGAATHVVRSAGRSGSAWLIENLATGLVRSPQFSVTPGGQYDISAWVRGEMDPDTTRQNGHIKIRFFDAAGASIPGGNGATYAHVHSIAPGSVDASWEQRTGAFTAPASAASAAFEVWVAGVDGWLAVDDVRVTASGSSTNLVPDSGMEQGSWEEIVAGGAAATSLWRGNWAVGAPRSGTYAYVLSNLIHGNVASDRFAVTGGGVLETASWVRGEMDAAASDPRVRLTARFYDGGGAQLSQQHVWASPGELHDTRWNLLSATFDVPAGAVEALVQPYTYMSNGWVAFDDVHASLRSEREVTTHYAGVGYATDGVMTWTFGDHLGSTGATWTPSTGVVGRQRYEPFGAVRTTSNITTDIGYTGQRADDSTGLMYYRARYYDPGLARFTQGDTMLPDPGRSVDLDRFAYVRNNPFAYTDPTGHWPSLGSVFKAATVAASFLPVVGDVMDVVDGVKAAMEGDWVGVGIAVVSIVSPVGIGRAADVIRSASRAGDNIADVGNAARRTSTSGVDAPSSGRPGCNSFIGSTLVLMGDGSYRAIAEVELGHEVWALDPETGESGPREVTALITGSGEKTLVDIGSGDDTLVATDDHPIWAEDVERWIDADQVRPGTDLLTPDGTTITVERTGTRVEVTTVYNFTVEGLHTYFVELDDRPVLVHNTDVVACLTDGGGSNPWPDGRPGIAGPVPEGGMTVNMAVGPGQVNGHGVADKPGAWATFDDITSVDDVRHRLAVLPEWKPEVTHVQTYHVPAGIQVQVGQVGDQVSATGRRYDGGGTQVHILNASDRARLVPVGRARPI